MDAQVGAQLSRAISSAGVDVALRRALLQRKCEEIERVLSVLGGAEEQRRVAASAAAAGENDQKTNERQVAEVGQSIQDAIDRARRIRDEMAGLETDGQGGSSDEENRDETEETAPGDGGSNKGESRSLQGILAMARAIRGTQHSGEPISAEQERHQPRVTRLRLEYPRKLKFLVEQLGDKRAEQFRFAFCCRMSERLSTSQARKQALSELGDDVQLRRLDAPVARIQVSFPKQMDRLRRAHALLAAYVRDRLSTDSEAIQNALQTPTLSRLLPLHVRLSLAKQMQRVLENERQDLARRTPPPPRLSAVAIAHRDAKLAQIRLKRSARGDPDSNGIRNDVLFRTAAGQTRLQEDGDVLDKLQVAWEAGNSRETSPTAYVTKVRELLLTEASTLTLLAFKTCFAARDGPPEDEQVRAMMQLARLVDSMALARGRRYRSIVAT